MFEMILNLFLNSELKIKNIIKLKEYILFCIENNTENIKSKTAKHHILPKSKNLPFTNYKNFKENPWNCATLTHKNHYIAHWLLFESIDHISISHSFIAMHNKDTALERIDNNCIVNSEIYNSAMIERSRHYKKWCNEISKFDKELSNAQYYARKNYKTKTTKFYQGIPFKTWQSNRMQGKNNIINIDGVINKILETKSNTFINGKNMHQIGAIRASETMKKEIVLEDGEISSIYKETSKKLKEHLMKEVILEDGTVTTNAKIRGNKHSKILSAKGKKFILKSVFNDNINYILYANDIRKISPGLEKLSIDSYLGKSKYGKTILVRKNKENLIGLYCIQTNEKAEFINNIDEFIKNL